MAFVGSREREMDVRGGLPEELEPDLSSSLRVKVCPEDTEEGRR